jgi:hypothetical protein
VSALTLAELDRERMFWFNSKKQFERRFDLMDYPNAEGLSQSFKTNHWLIHRLVDGLSHAESIVQPPYDGNCLNWVLGHIIVSRNNVLKLLKQKPVLNEREDILYKTGSSPITGDGQGLEFEVLLEKLDRAQEIIFTSLAEATEEQLNNIVETSRGIKPVGKHVAGLNWHETYHIGQLELLREVSRTNLAD